jgi:nucleotide-binding universal stress UspA family protein
MSTHARGGLSRLWLGSVADQLLRDVAVPVLLVKPSQPDPPIEITKAAAFRRVVLPLDGSALAEAVLAPLLDLLGPAPQQTTCTIVQVYSPPPPAPAVSLHVAAFPPTPTTHDPEIAAAPCLDEVTERLREAGLQVQVVTVTHEQTASAILETAVGMGADLIAIATHGRGGIKRLLIGSVADAVVRGAETTVLVYRPPV